MLVQVVVQLARDVVPLFFLRGDEPAGQILDAAMALGQGFFRAAPASPIRTGAPEARRSIVVCLFTFLSATRPSMTTS